MWQRQRPRLRPRPQPCRVCEFPFVAVMAIHTSGANSIVRATRSPSPTDKAANFSGLYLQILYATKKSTSLERLRPAAKTGQCCIKPGKADKGLLVLCDFKLVDNLAERASRSKSRVHVSRNNTALTFCHFSP